MTRPALVLVSLLSTTLGCGEVLVPDAGLADSGAPEDTGVVPDTGVPRDGGDLDSGIQPDTGLPDSGVATDTGVVPDAGPPTAQLRLRRSGGGEIAVDNPAVACPPDCDLDIPVGGAVTLTAAPAPHWVFSSWSTPSCSSAQCPITVIADVELTATFVRREYDLTVQLAGGASGTVTSTSVGLVCASSPCTVTLDSEAQVVLHAEPSPGATFAGWSGACAGLAMDCVVTMDDAKTVTATFELDLARLDATISGDGRITSTPPGIDCPGTCAATFTRGQAVNLEASPGAGQRLTGWTGACAGQGACSVTLANDRSVGADFEPILVPVQIRREGDAASDGVVTGASGAIACPSTCATTLPVGAQVTLNASTSINTALFSRWPSGPCAGQGPQCTFTVQESLPIVAVEFVRNQLTVTTSGQPGRVTASVGGVDCPGTCAATAPVGAQVNLTAIPDNADVRFSDWTGPCAGQGAACTFSLSALTTVDATFIVRPPPVVNHQAADLVLGQPDFTADLANNGGESLSTLNRPRYCHSDGTRLWVSDGDNARVLQWNSLPTQPFMQPASVVIGQASATSHVAGTTQATFADRPGNVVVRQGRLYAADFNSSRVLMWSSIPTAHGAPANAVIGQTSYVASSGAVGIDRIDRPYTIAAGANTDLLIVDTFNHRVVGLSPAPATTGRTDAGFVLGQFDAQGVPTFDQEDNPSPPTAGSMHYPFDATYDPVTDRLFVVDTNNNRILGWSGYPSTPRAADFVLGQTSFGASAANAGQASTNAVGLDGPRVVAVHAGSLFVADGSNSRVMVWTPVPSQTGTPAAAVLGQPGLTSRGPQTTAMDLSSPWGICGAGNQLFVVDINDNRVLRFALSP